MPQNNCASSKSLLYVSPPQFLYVLYVRSGELKGACTITNPSRREVECLRARRWMAGLDSPLRSGRRIINREEEMGFSLRRHEGAASMRTLERGLCRERLQSPQINNAPPFHCCRRRGRKVASMKSTLSLLIANLRSPIVHICATPIFPASFVKGKTSSSLIWRLHGIIIKDEL